MSRDGPVARFVLEEEAGLAPVRVRYSDGAEPFAELTAATVPVCGPAPHPTPQLAAMLGLDASDIESGSTGPTAWSAGVPFLFIPLRSQAALARAHLDVSQWRSLLSNW